MAINHQWQLLTPSASRQSTGPSNGARLNSLAKLPGPMREEILEPFQEIRSDFPQDPCLTANQREQRSMASRHSACMGFYIQGNYHFMPEFLTKLSPKRFGEGSTFTAVIRYDRVNTNLDNSNGTGGWGNLEQISFGLNYRPIEDTVIQDQLSVSTDGV